MKVAIEKLKAEMQAEAGRHMIDQSTVKVDILPVIVSPHAAGFDHGVQCICGHAFNVVTQHSANTPQGQGEFAQAVTADYAEHFRTAMAEMVYQLYEPTQ